jgi:hypothetical protein
MAVRCPQCNDVLKHPVMEKHLLTDCIPTDWKCTKAVLKKYVHKPCQSPIIKAFYATEDNPEYPQRHVLDVIEGDILWRQAVELKPNKNGEKSRKAAHCDWTDDVSGDPLYKFNANGQNTILQRERRFMSIFQDRQGDPLTWFGMAKANRDRVTQAQSVQREAEKQQANA